jgi:hypothetical protein
LLTVAQEIGHSGEQDRSRRYQADGLVRGPWFRKQAVIPPLGQPGNEELGEATRSEMLSRIVKSPPRLRRPYCVESHRQQAQNGDR